MMASSTIRKAIGAVKDHTTISLAKVTNNSSPDLEVIIVKATSHHDEPPDEKYSREILNMMSMSSSKGHTTSYVFAISKRLRKTRDWIVALKSLMLLHKLLCYGDPVFGQELMFASWKGTKVLNMSDFRDEAHSNSYEHSEFMRNFASYLDQKLEFTVYEHKLKKMTTQDQELKSARVVDRLNSLLKLLELLLACKPKGVAKSTRMVLFALQVLVKDSFRLYSDISDALKYFQDCFYEMNYGYCVRVFDAYVNAAKMMDELVAFYSWCKDLELVRSLEFPEVQKISHELLGKLEGVVREKRTRQKCPHETSEEEITSQNINEIKALPPPENFNPQPQINQLTENLLNLDFNDHQESNNLGLALFSTNRETKTNSAWQNPAAENGKPDWELALVESTSNLSKQNADLAGGFDSLMLNGMYHHGTVVRQHASNGGSASSVTLPESNGNTMMNKKVLALPTPDGTAKPVGQQDPFAASLSVPPPPYVQIADMEKKRDLVTQEQQIWQQYSTNGMQGPMGFAKIASYYDASMPYGYYT